MTANYLRRIVHASGSLIPGAYLAGLVTWDSIRLLLAAGAFLAVVLEVLRLRAGLDWAIYDRLTRDYEQETVAGYALAVIAGAIVGWVFPPTVAVAALLMLTIGDPFSGLLGDVDDVEERPAWWVMVAMFLVCSSIGLVLLAPRAAVAAGAVAVLADATKPRVYGYVVDDNFSIPIGAAVAAWVAVTFVPPILCSSACLPGL